MKVVHSGLAVVASVLMLTSVAQAGDPLKIGLIETLSGPSAATGLARKKSTQFAIDKLNQAGGFNGEKIVLVEYNSGGTPAGAVSKFQQAAAEGVNIVVQGSSSAIASALTVAVRDHNRANPGKEVLYINAGAEAQELTGDLCHFYHFRASGTAPARIKALAMVMKEEGALGKRVYSINQDYNYGQDVENAIVENEGVGGYKVVDKVMHPVNRTQDFTPFVDKIKAAAPDTVITGNWGNDLLLLMRAVSDASIKVRFGTIYLDQPGNLSNAGETALGHYVVQPYNVDVTNSTVAAEYEAYSGHVPAYVEPPGIFAILHLGKALAKIDSKGGPIDVKKIALALESTALETDLGPRSFRKEDHQLLLPLVVSRVEKGVKHLVDGTDMGFKPVKVIPADQIVNPIQPSCKMERPEGA